MHTIERVMLWRLLHGDTVTHREMVHHVYGHEPDGGPLFAKEVLSVRLCSVRKECPVTIHGWHGMGLYVAECDLPALHDWLVEELKQHLRGKDDHKQQAQRGLPNTSSTGTN